MVPSNEAQVQNHRHSHGRSTTLVSTSLPHPTILASEAHQTLTPNSKQQKQLHSIRRRPRPLHAQLPTRLGALSRNHQTPRLAKSLSDLVSPLRHGRRSQTFSQRLPHGNGNGFGICDGKPLWEWWEQEIGETGIYYAEFIAG